MGRAIKPNVKLADLFDMWWKAREELEKASYRMAVTPTQIRDEAMAREVFETRLRECNC